MDKTLLEKLLNIKLPSYGKIIIGINENSLSTAKVEEVHILNKK